MKAKKITKSRANGGGGHAGEGLLLEIKPLLPLIFDSSEDAAIAVGVDGTIIYVNHQFLDLTALAIDQLLSKKFSDVSQKNPTISSFSGMIQKAISTKEAATNLRILDATESLYEVTTTTPIINHHQSAVGIVLVAKQFVIEKQLAEQAFRQNEIYQKAIMNSVSFIIWLKDTEGKFLAVNNAFAKMAGVDSPKSVEGKTDFDLWPEHLAKGYVEDDLKVMESGAPTVLVEQIEQQADKGLYWAETYKAPVVIDDQVIGTVGYARDVSEQKKLFSTIVQKDAQLDSLLMSLPLLIVRYDKNCKRVFVNTGGYGAKQNQDAQNLLGKTPKEVWDHTAKNITADAYQEKLEYVLSNGEPQTFEMYFESDHKTTVHMVNLLPEFDAQQQVTGVIAIANDVTEISKYRHDLEYLAYHDTLTSLPNRTLLNQRLHQAAASKQRFGLMFMDLDFFKTINDTLGHEVGDNLLLDAAKRIAASVRSDDVVARTGGDEFAILIPDLQDDADLAGLAEKIADNLSAPFNIEGINFFVTASVGIACYPTDSEEVDDLIKYADTAMYEAKKQGRNNFQFYSPDMTQLAMEHLAIATALRYAIQKDELFLLYQPKVDIATGRILGAETLLRWHGKVLGRIQPDKFIPIAEESGLILEIGAWVLRASCEAAVQLNQNRGAPINIAINVSSKEFIGNDYIQDLQCCLQETGCKPEWLTIEITESLLLQDTGKALETLNAIDKMGIALSIDDFGTGYSALAYLSKFPIRQVKIDRSFVMDICDSKQAATLVKAIIAMADSLGKGLVAEGIETSKQATLIKSYGCHEAQGYLYSKPIPFSKFVHMVGQQNNALI